MNLTEIVQKEISNISLDQVFKEKLSEQVKDTFQSVLKDGLGHWSDFSKQIKEEIKKQIGFDPSKIDLTTYNEFVQDQCIEVLKETMSEKRAEVLRSALREKLGIVDRKEIDFEDFIQEISESLLDAIKSEFDEDNCACGDLPKYRIVCGRNKKYNWWCIDVYQGEQIESYEKIAHLTITERDEQCLSARCTNYRTGPLDRIFRAMAFNRCVVRDLEYYDEVIEYDPYDY